MINITAKTALDKVNQLLDGQLCRMKKTNNRLMLCFLACFCLSTSLFSQELAWLKSSTSNNMFTSHSFYSSTHYNGDFYFAGDFWQDLTIEDVNIEITGDSADGFILRMNEAGEASALWHFGSDNYVRINAMEVNPVTGSLIVVGYFRENMMYNDELWTSPFYSTGFVLSLDSDGDIEWINEMEPEDEFSFANGDAIAIDTEGNIFVGMAASGGLTMGGQTFFLDFERSGAIILKLSKDGNFMSSELWESKIFEGFIDIVDMEIDSDNKLVIGGSNFGTIDIADSTFFSPPTSTQIFIVKQSNDLDLDWFKTYPSTNAGIRDILVDNEDMIISLQYQHNINIDGKVLNGSGSYGDMGIISIAKDGQLNWVKNFTLSENGGNSGVYGTAIHVYNDQYFVGGLYQGDVVHEGELILDNSPLNMVYQYPFLISMNKDGQFTKAYDFAGSSSPSRITCMAANDSHLLFAGDYFGTVALGDSSVSTINSTLFYGALEIETSSVENQKSDHALFDVYPTTTSDVLYMKTNGKVSSISIVDSQGSFVQEYGREARQFDIRNLPKGVYFMTAYLEGRYATRKFIKN